MAERPKTKEAKPFAEFLKDAPPASQASGEESIPLTGVVMRSEKEGMFVLATQEGQMLELNAEDVQNYEVVQETGPQKIVRVDVSAKALATAGGAGAIGSFRTMVYDYITRKELIKDPIFDPTRKELIKDPWTDPWTRIETEGTIQETTFDPGLGVDPAVEAGLTPFIMATPHHASQAAIAMQPGAAAYKPVYFDPTRKELIKDPAFDTLKELRKDPIIDPVTWVENTGTLQEQVFDPGLGNVVNPAAAAGGAQMAFAAQPQQAATTAASAALRTIKELISDPTTRKELIFDTYKEIVKEPIWDTRKEVYETIVEVGGTIQEGIGEFDPGAVWNLPGVMF